MIYLTSDLHFGHNKEFLYKPRGFSSIEEHDQTIVKNWNSIVEDDDIVIMLGDLMLMDNEHGINCLRSLKGNKYYIRGNHDTDNRVELYNRPEEGNLRYLGFAFLLNYRKYHFYLSHYPTLTTNFDDNGSLKKRTLNLFGHTHSKEEFFDENNPGMYNVAMDAHNCYPVSIEDIITKMEKKVEECRNLKI